MEFVPSLMLADFIFCWDQGCSGHYAASAGAQAPSGKVTVVTSFSKDVTDPFKKAFEADYADWIAAQNARFETHGIPGADLRPW